MVLNRHIKAVFYGLRPEFLPGLGRCVSILQPAFIRPAKQRKAVKIDLSIINIPRIISEIRGVAFLFCKETFLHQPVEIDEIGIACKSRK